MIVTQEDRIEQLEDEVGLVRGRLWIMCLAQITTLIFLLLLTVKVYANTPAQATVDAWRDFQTLPVDQRAGVRYLSLYNIEPKDRPGLVRTCSYILNSCSRLRNISHPRRVHDQLFAFSIGQYVSNQQELEDWHTAWESMASVDPYFHIRTQVIPKAKAAVTHSLPAGMIMKQSPVDLVNGGGRIHGKFLFTQAGELVFGEDRMPVSRIPIAPKKLFVSRNGKNVLLNPPVATSAAVIADAKDIQTVTTDGGWVGIDTMSKLRAGTGSIGPVLRADYFAVQASSQLDGGQYYRMAGIPPKLDDWLAQIGINKQDVERLRVDGGASIAISGVTKKPRRIIRLQGLLGGFWATLDIANPTADNDPLRRPINEDGSFEDANRFDAGEYIATGLNGLQRYGLYDSAGERVDSVPDNLAKDDSDPLSDGRLQPMVSCVRCHNKTGLLPFTDDFTRITQTNDLQSLNPQLLQRTSEFYDQPRLARYLEFDRATHAAAVKQATGGLTVEKAAEAMAHVTRQFAYLPVEQLIAAREVGCDVQTFKSLASKSRDPILLTLSAGRPVLRKQWESSFAEIALAAAAGKGGKEQ